MKKYQILDGGRASFKTTRHVTRISYESILTPNLVSYVVGKDQGGLEKGLVAEFRKVIERITDGEYTCDKKTPGAHCWYKMKPLTIQFKNGSEINFVGSKDAMGIKGRSLPSTNHKWGFVFLDEFADYAEADGRNLVEQLVPTFIRGSIPETYSHPFWGDGSELNLDKYELDSTGKVIMEQDEYGKWKPKINSGTETLNVIFLFSWNPPSNKYAWIYDWLEDYKDRPDAMYKRVNYTDVYDELLQIGLMAIITEAETVRTHNPVKYQHTWLGEATSTEGLYFTGFNPETSRVSKNTLDRIDPRNCVIGVDVGVSNATTFVFQTLDNDNNRTILKMYYHSNRNESDPDNERGFAQYAKDLIDFTESCLKEYNIQTNKPIHTYIDPSAKAFMMEVKLQMTKRKKHILKPVKAKNDRESTLGHVRDLITEDVFKYVYPQKHTKELENEFYRATINPKASSEDIIKENDHLIDAIRYSSYPLKKKERTGVRKGWLNG